jgi:hypothetical protein
MVVACRLRSEKKRISRKYQENIKKSNERTDAWSFSFLSARKKRTKTKNWEIEPVLN